MPDDKQLSLVQTVCMEPSILIIDDDQELCALLAEFLALEGFSVSCIHDGADSIELCRAESFSAIVLDVMLPRIQGFDVLRRLREFSETPVIMLTARGDATDRIVGLEMGADDYLPKPCNPRELAARLRAVLRRSEQRRSEPTRGLLECGDLRLNPADRRVHFADEELKLTTAEFNVLAVLMERAGTVVDKETLSQQALGRALTAYDRSIDVHISNLRKKIPQQQRELIMSVRGVGYQLTLSGNS